MARRGLTYGAGALAAAARGDRLMWALHRAALNAGILPAMPAVALLEGWRQSADVVEEGSPWCDWFVAGLEVEPLTAALARVLGELGVQSGVHDPVAVAVVESAFRRRHAMVTGRSTALVEVAAAVGHEPVVHVV